MTAMQMLFSGNGRIRRRDYWLWSIGVYIVYWVAIIIAVAIGNSLPGAQPSTEVPMLAVVVDLVGAVFLLWTNVCITAKRWHDRDKSGFMYLILFIPLVGFVWTFIECGCLDGTPGPNRYGPSPKGIADPSKVF